MRAPTARANRAPDGRRAAHPIHVEVMQERRDGGHAGIAAGLGRRGPRGERRNAALLRRVGLRVSWDVPPRPLMFILQCAERAQSGSVRPGQLNFRGHLSCWRTRVPRCRNRGRHTRRRSGSRWSGWFRPDARRESGPRGRSPRSGIHGREGVDNRHSGTVAVNERRRRCGPPSCGAAALYRRIPCPRSRTLAVSSTTVSSAGSRMGTPTATTGTPAPRGTPGRADLRGRVPAGSGQCRGRAG